MLDNKYNNEIDGFIMYSSLGTALTNIFLRYHESIWLEDCMKDFNPVCYKRYVDDIFALFNYINKKQILNMKFSVATETNESLSLLDMKIF